MSAVRFALIDCNNFYVSCERLFRPDLAGRPVAVLSNNDGCIVARSAEVKQLGVKMAVPLHQVKALVERHQIQLFSSNYTLYADISSRVMSLLAGFAPRQEVYSIDESFLDLTGVCDRDPVAYGQRIRQTIARCTGIPVCVGMGPTKTLAKLANHAAKRWPKTGGVVDLDCPVRRRKLMQRVPVREVWGVGSRLSKKLNQLGVVTAWDLACMPQDSIRGPFSVVLARTVMELNGQSCLALEESPPDKQQIVCSRSFRERLTEYDQLAQALTQYASRACEKLRSQHGIAGVVSVSIRTSPFSEREPYYQRVVSLSLPCATQDTRQIIKAARQLLGQIYQPGYRYQHAGVTLSRIRPASDHQQHDLFAGPDSTQAPRAGLMDSLDAINRRFPHAIAVSTSGLNKGWGYQPSSVSPRYTTHWAELARVKCH